MSSRWHEKAAEYKSEPKISVDTARKLAIVCALDFEPFNISKRRGFRAFCEWNRIDPAILPNPRSISETGLSDVYEYSKKEVITALQSAPKTIALTLDCWTDNCMKRSFINHVVHFLDEKFAMKTFTLKTEIFPHPHTGLKISKNILSTLKEFGLENRKVIAVSDNGANVIAGIRMAKIHRLPSAAHNLYLFISKECLKADNFSAITILISKLKTVFKAVIMYRHDELSKIFEQEQQCDLLKLLKSATETFEMLSDEEKTSPEFDSETELELPDMKFDRYKSLKNANATLWGSLLMMVCSFVENSVTLNIALTVADRTDLHISTSEKEKLLEFKGFLEVFESCTTAGVAGAEVSNSAYDHNFFGTNATDVSKITTTGSDRFFFKSKKKRLFSQ